jgi:hypothetical protein
MASKNRITYEDLTRLGYRLNKDGTATRIVRQPQQNVVATLEQATQKEKRNSRPRFRLVLPEPSVRILVEVYLTRPLDEVNAHGAFKAIEDAMRYEGLLYDDTIRDNELIIKQIQVASEAEQRVEINLSIIP